MAICARVRLLLLITLQASAQEELHQDMRADTPEHVAINLLSFSANDNAGIARILEDLSRVDKAVAMEVKDHPETLSKEAALLHNASNMAIQAGEATASQLRFMSQQDVLNNSTNATWSKQNASTRKRNTSACTNTRNATKSIINASTISTSNNSVGNFMLEAGAGLDMNTATTLSDLASAEKAISSALQGQPNLLKQEAQLLRNATKMALRAGESAANVLESRGHLQSVEKQAAQLHAARTAQAAKLAPKEIVPQANSTRQANASLTKDFLRNAQQDVSSLESHGRNLLREVREVKAEVIDTLGERDPALAARIMHLMNKISTNETSIMHNEANFSERIEASVAQGKKHETEENDKLNKTRESNQTSTQLRNLSSISQAEATAVSEDATVLDDMKQIQRAVSKAVQGIKEKSRAHDVEQLLSTAHRDQIKIVNAEHEMASQLFKGSGAFKVKALIQHEKRNSDTAGQAQQLMNFARTEDALAGDESMTLQDVQHTQVEISKQMKTSNPKVEQKVHQLLDRVKLEQRKVIEADKRAASLDRKLAAKQGRHPQMHFNKTGNATMVTRKEVVGANSTKMVLADVAATKQKLRKLALRQAKIASANRRLIAETAQVETNLADALGSTGVGEQIASLVHSAQDKEQNALISSQRQAELANKDVQTIRKFEQALNAEGLLVHTSQPHDRNTTSFHQKPTLKVGALAQQSTSSMKRGKMQSELADLAEEGEEQEEDLEDEMIGAQVESILRAAKKEERRAMKNAMRELALANEEDRTLENLEEELFDITQ